MKNQILEKFYNLETQKLEIGIDEVGRGPMFGRVYCAAVILPNNDTFKYETLKDSKKFTSKKKITEVADYIKNNAVSWAIAYEDEKTIDNLNIRNSVHKAMHASVSKILKNYSNQNDIELEYSEDFYLLIDGNDFKPYTYLAKTSNLLKQVNHVLIEGGDNKFCSIAAASILAKVERDKWISEMCKKYTKLVDYYNLEKNKGYGTAQHLDGIKKYGISPWHRTTYGCCKNALVNQEDFYL